MVNFRSCTKAGFLNKKNRASALVGLKPFIAIIFRYNVLSLISTNENLNYSLTSAYIFISTILPHFTALILRYSIESPIDSFGLEYIDKCVRLRISYCCYNLVDLMTRNY